VDRLLAPGMRLMRRIGIPRKFALVTLLLVIPLVMTIAASVADRTARLELTDDERAGARYAVPLVGLLVEVARAGDLAGSGRPAPSGLLEAVAEVDAAHSQFGERLDVGPEVGPEWGRLRVQLLELAGTATSPLQRPAGVTSEQEAERRHLEAARRVAALLGRVTHASHLVLDPDMDSHHAITCLIEGLPRLVLASAELAATKHAGGGTAEDERLERRLADQALLQAAESLSAGLSAARRVPGWSALEPRLSADAAALSALVAGYSARLQGDEAAPAPGAATAPVSPLGPAVLGDSAARLADGLGASVHTLLDRRASELATDRLRPVAYTLSLLLVVAYLLAAVYRATGKDAQAVLEDISSVTSGALTMGPPLEGSDEFARMSRAVVFARDRLTSLLGTLRYQAGHDELTALGNRTLFTEKLEEALASATGPVAVVLVDLEGFKDVNDSFGHDIGDRLLRAVGVRFHRAAGRRNIVARMSGDEFAVLISDPREAVAAQDVVLRLRAALEQPLDLDGRLLKVQAAFGVATATSRGVTATELTRDADVALNAARAAGKGRISVFETAMQDRIRERTELSADLVQALERGEMSLMYQPIVDLGSDVVRGVESLVRWNHPQRGPISPGIFVPLAEATGMIIPLGRWVLRQSMRRLAQWQEEFPDGYPLTLDVNVSTDQLADPDLVGEVLSLIDETGVPPSSLVLEITESALVADLDAALRPLRRLAAAGVRIALDDFGTGYSSLAYLRKLPVSVLKVDRSFIEDTDSPDSDATVLMRGIVELGRGLGMEVVAEGIQTTRHLRLVRDAGCHLGQGYLWSPALRAEAVSAVLARGGRLAPAALPVRSGRTAGPES